MSREVYILEHHKDRSGWVVLLVTAALIAFWKWILLIATLACIGWLLKHCWQYAKEINDNRISRNNAIASRADRQHHFALAGDPVGIYGDYPATTIPMTQPEKVDWSFIRTDN